MPSAAVKLAEVDEEKLETSFRFLSQFRMRGCIVFAERISTSEPRSVVLKVDSERQLGVGDRVDGWCGAAELVA